MRAVLAHYGITNLKQRGKELRGKCPIHNGDGPEAFHVNTEKNCFQCFAGSCKARGNVLDFVAAMERCTIRDAAMKLAEWFSVSTTRGAPSSPAASPRAVAPQTHAADISSSEQGKGDNQALTFELKGIDPTHAYIAERGFTEDIAKELGIGYFPGRGSMSGRVVIPIHKETGELVAYAGRSIDGSEPKYKLPAGFHKSLVLYNLHRAIQRQSSTVVLVEGFFDCIKVWQAGFPAVALMGSSMSQYQEELLRSQFTGALLLFDGDAAGRECTKDCLLRLGTSLWVKAILLDDGQQPDGLTSDQLHELLQ